MAAKCDHLAMAKYPATTAGRNRNRNSYELKSTRDYRETLRLRPTGGADLAWVTALERHADNRPLIGQWTDAQHLAAVAGEAGREHWIIERDGKPAGYLIAYDCRASGAGLHVKRILVADKERGTGGAALAAFLEDAFGRRGFDCAWLNVRADNARAQSVYTRLGFRRFEPDALEAARYDAAAEAPGERAFRMRLARDAFSGG